MKNDALGIWNESKCLQSVSQQTGKPKTFYESGLTLKSHYNPNNSRTV